ncbi:MAG: TetR family transcriptional regulator [Novosphingobium sp.]
MARKSRAEAAETRLRIMVVAQALFAKRGFAGTSTALIAKQANVSEGALFNHFKDKKVLFSEILLELQRDFDRGVRIAALGDGHGSALDSMRRGFAASVRLARDPTYARIVLAEGRAVLGDAEWARIDSGMGRISVEYGLKAVASEHGKSVTDLSRIATLILGMLNETVFALQRKELTDPAASLKLIEQAMLGWLDIS